MKEQETEAPRRYAFNHEAGDKITDILGLSPDYPERVQKAIEHAAIEHDNSGHMLEEIMNKIRPKNTVEAAFVGYCLGIWTHDKWCEIRGKKVIAALIEHLKDGDDEG